jgi:beta-lactamase regulating signal transducer with metallopeptidase domain
MTAWLTDTLLYSGMLIALVLLVRRPVARWFGPKLAYALWALPALRLVLPPIELPAGLAPEPAQLSDQALLALAMAAEASPSAAPPPTPLWERADVWLVLWLVGAVLFLAWRIAGYRRMRRELLAEARPVGEAPGSKSGAGGRIRLVETPAVSSPVAFGVRDKVVALPPLFMAMADRSARDLAIAHELAHHRGHDIAANFAAQPLLALHWFNPLAWIGWRAMRRDQEAACDARVLESCGREQRAAYADLIASFAAGPRLALAAPMACPMAGGLWAEKSIIHRLRSLSMADVSPRRRLVGRILLVGAMLALPLTASISYASAQARAVEPVPVAPSDAPQAPLPPQPPQAAEAPLPPQPPEAPQVERHEQRFVLHRDGGEAGDGGDADPTERHVFTMRVDGPLSKEQRKHFEAMRKELMKNRGDWAKMARDGHKMALAMADMRAHMPIVSRDCDKAGGEMTRSWTDNDGREHVVICERRVREQAQAGEREALMAKGQAAMALRDARAAIAEAREMTDSVRQEVLADLDREIARLDARP